MSENPRKWFSNAGTLIFGAALGVTVSHFVMAGDMRELSTEVRHIRDSALPQIRKDSSDERARTDARIFEVAGLVRTVLELVKEREKTNQELINLIKVQNDLLSRQLNTSTRIP